ncbi:PREDICTED: uncharacterized protein LOC109155351 [Ipomoea nil]|uniref:uncharacterized protein LOC109155351 n=1 Tax=Ipomoea nil TaxID=35883 RepID=UPI000901570F|nr:PREDICTED: uncharacterized protein LOC109155351 [Ipomoea nil]
MTSSSASATQSVGSSEASILKRRSNDVGWKYGILVDGKNLDKVKCLLCGKVLSGGVHRIKEHIGHIQGNVAPCSKATKDDQLKCKNAINEVKMRRKNKKVNEDNLRAEVNIDSRSESIDVEDLQGSFGSMKPPRSLGPMDKFASGINPEPFMNFGKTLQQQRIDGAIWKERTTKVKEYICRWAYEAAIPFHAFEKDSFKMMLEAVGQFGPGVESPSRYEMSETFLKKEVDKVRESLKKHEEEWKLNGCSIMTDAWTNRKRRSVMNLCVNSNLGTIFLSSKECSLDSHTSQYIYEFVEHGIEQVGVENVVQVVTDNASNNMGASKLLKEKRPTIFWTSCATHTINLMLQSIGNLPRYKKVLDQAKALTIFIYAHHTTLAMMRTFTKKRDIVRPGVTRFASSFLTLQSLAEKKIELKAMFSSNEWEACKFSKIAKGKVAHTTVTSLGFWQGVTTCLKVFAPLVRVLRLVDCDSKPSMGFVYGELMRAKEEIKHTLSDVPRNYKSIIDIIEEKMKDRLDSPLHLMAYLLNPYYHYKDPQLHLDEVVGVGVVDFCDILFVNDFDMQNKILSEELPKYKKKEGMFGRSIAIKACGVNDDNFNPANWWSTFGISAPLLRRIAIKILSLTSSSSGCERNWSTFEGIHTKKRNRLESNRLNNLVFVQFNATLMNKNKQDKNIEKLVGSDASLAQDWIVENVENDENEPGMDCNNNAIEVDEALQPRRSARLRDLDEDNFESEGESEEEINEVEFEDDGQRVIEQYGQDEEIGNDPIQS